MHSDDFTRFEPAIKAFAGNAQSPSLHIESETHKGKVLAVHYAPFEWVTPQAQLIIVGITPGDTQAVEALNAARDQLQGGATHAQALERAKLTGAFSGQLRKNLVAMLDHVGLNRWARVATCDQLFGSHAHLVQTASVLQYPTFVNGERYSGLPALRGSAMLRAMVLKHFVPMAQSLPKAKILAVGDVPWDTLQWLAADGLIDHSCLLGQLPHPSPANQERVNWFIDKKNSCKPVSNKTNTRKLDEMREQMRTAIAQLPALVP
jgi:hypothetical protein